MLTKKLLAAVGLAGALMLSLVAPAEARGWGGGGFHHGPVYRGGFHRGPGYGGPMYRGGDWRRGPMGRERAREWRRERNPYGNRY